MDGQAPTGAGPPPGAEHSPDEQHRTARTGSDDVAADPRGEPPELEPCERGEGHEGKVEGPMRVGEGGRREGER